MSQLFNLQLATDTLLADAQQLGVSVQQLCQIKVHVKAALLPSPTARLQLHYSIQLPCSALAAQLDWPTWESAQVVFTDYLWERTCLECFITGDILEDTQASGYIEINGCPNGRYALYKFEGYRTPASIPPKPLLTADKSRCAAITWTNHLVESDLSSRCDMTAVANLAPSKQLRHPSKAITTATFTAAYHYQRCFELPLEQLISDHSIYDKSTSFGISKLQPCVILRFGSISLYFASAHACPPDFHQRRYWSSFDNQ